MGAHIFDDPFKGLTDAKVAQIIRDYRNLTLTVDEVTSRHRIGTTRLRAILEAKKVALRGNKARKAHGRTLAQVFLGMQPGGKAPGNDAVERAKTRLRARGCIVYDAEITEGRAGRGLIRVDNKRLTPAEVIQAAADALKGSGAFLSKPTEN